MLWADADPLVGAFWGAVFQLFVLAIAGVVANIIFRRYRDRATARQELLNAIDQFSVQLYKPRKIYQIMIEQPEQLLAGVCTAEQRDIHRLQAIHQALQELTEATGRFRTLQVALISLYGFNLELLAHYLAIWTYLKELRHRMEKGTSLKVEAKAGDAFYRLFDSFRYRVSVAAYSAPPQLVQPPPDVLAEMQRAGAAVYNEYFQ
jgi:hypothetical protein